MNNLINQFIEARKDFLETLDKFPKDKIEEALFGEWNLKGVIAHFSAWDIYFTNALKLLKQDKEVKHWQSINKFNEVEVNKRKKWAWEKIHNEFVKAGGDFIKEYNNIPNKLKEKFFWKNKYD